MVVRTARITALQVALGLSLAVHAGILTLRFVDPQAFERVLTDTPLEVILVNARSNEAPVKAQAIAQANLATPQRTPASASTRCCRSRCSCSPRCAGKRP
jgi:protein TonB